MTLHTLSRARAYGSDREEKMNFRYLNKDEIDCRVAMCKQNGVSLVLYKDARVDQNILDEVFGIFGWQRSHQLIDGNLYCTVSVRNPETGEWVSKQDVGTESNTEKEKGQASDSFKRACFNLGIGRELYTAPFIWIPADGVKIENKNGKYSTYDRFSVKSITIEEGKIVQLEILNDSIKCVVYAFGKTPAEEKKDSKVQEVTAKREAEAKKELEFIDGAKAINVKKTLFACKVEEGKLLEHYHIPDVEHMTNAQFKDFGKKWKILAKEWGGTAEIKKGA